jgi:hypothetical protein
MANTMSFDDVEFYYPATTIQRLVASKMRRDYECHATTEQLFASSRENVTRLEQSLCGLECAAVIRGVDRKVIPVSTPDSNESASVLPEYCEVPATIYDAEDELLAFLELAPCDVMRSGSLQKLLRVLVESSARSMLEPKGQHLKLHLMLD